MRRPLIATLLLFLLATGRTNASPLKADEEIIFFPTAASLDERTGEWRIPVHAWIFEPESKSLWRQGVLKGLAEALEIGETVADEELFKERAGMFLADSEGRKEITIRLGGTDHPLPPSEANGHIRAEIAVSIKNAREGEWVSFSAVMPEGDDRHFEGRVQLAGPEGVSVISDIDDTIKESNVLDKKELLANTFLRPFSPVAGMSAACRKWAAEGVIFHYLSASPWQLYRPLSGFLAKEGFPEGSLHLQDFRLKDSSFFNLFRSPEASKVARIEAILSRYPKRRFILLGDSGEKDPEVYGAVARRHPGQAAAIFIRRVPGADNSPDRFAAAFEGTGEIAALFERGEEIATAAPGNWKGVPGKTAEADRVKISPFKSDGCSLFPDGSIKQRNLWCGCCLEHDIAYWRGGAEAERLAADETLKNCVRDKTGNAELAEMMYRGVRLGGSPVFPTWYRWGYGWPYGRGYKPLTDEELEAADSALGHYRKQNAAYACPN